MIVEQNDLHKPVTLFDLFFVFFKIGAFSFGGGFAMIPIIQREIVDNHRWMVLKEFIDMIAITQSAPGAVAVNSAVFTGYKLKGLKGAAACLLGTVLPSFLLILAIAVFLTTQGESPLLEKFFSGVRPAIVALILGAGLSMGQTSSNAAFDVVLALTALILLVVFRIHPILLIILGACAGIVRSRMSLHKKGAS